MARVTIDDCLQVIGSRFSLVLTAAKRANQLREGAEPKVARDGDKATVVALREIAAGYSSFEDNIDLEYFDEG